jgi:hypothetical protein
MVKNKYVRDNIKSFDCFNAGSSPIESQMKKRLLKKNKDSYREIARKSTHHLIKGDMINENVKKSMIRNIKTYESNKKPNIKRKILNYLKPFALTNPSTHLLH